MNLFLLFSRLEIALQFQQDELLRFEMAEVEEESGGEEDQQEEEEEAIGQEYHEPLAA